MARQTGILKFKGALGGLSFYEHKHYGMLVRKSNPVTAERMRRDPAFQRTRENSSEFGRTSKAAKLLRHALLGFLQEVGTGFLDNRMMKHMLDIKNKDLVNPRGQRCPGEALRANPALLGGFELHATQSLERVVNQAPVVNTSLGTIGWSGLTMQAAPAKATHARLTAFRGRIDFRNGTQDIRISESKTIALDNQPVDMTLHTEQPKGATGIEIWGVKLVFLQEINGQLYTLNTGAAKLLQSNSIPAESESISRDQTGAETNENRNIPLQQSSRRRSAAKRIFTASASQNPREQGLAQSG
jgi:hypothetical protein